MQHDRLQKARRQMLVALKATTEPDKLLQVATLENDIEQAVHDSTKVFPIELHGEDKASYDASW